MKVYGLIGKNIDYSFSKKYFSARFTNTNAIVTQAGVGTDYAAGLCKAYNAGGFTDWYLPAAWELNQCYNAAMIVNEVLGDTNGFRFSNSNGSGSTYWSSTEGSSSLAWDQDFDNGSMRIYNKSSIEHPVRAVRRF
jgi:hypothetical protein